jgi:hypothetical protein
MRKWIIGALIVALALGLYLKFRPKDRAIGEAYVGENNATIWNTTAQVRQSVGTLHWGDRVEVISRGSNQTRVRSASGVVGWAENHALLDPTLWQTEKNLQAEARNMPSQAPGRTKVFTNLHSEPGRDAPRIYQLPGGTAVSVLKRAVADVPASAAPAQSGEPSTDSGAEFPKREDWLLVSVATARESAPAPEGEQSAEANQAYLVTGNEQTATPTTGRAVPTLTGWVIGRFIDIDLPQTLRDYATASGLRPVAWFVLNKVATPSGDKPQYLVAGTHGGEGQPCDFTLLRVYTWGAVRQMYETSYVENDFCGSFPIIVGKQSGTGNPDFHFKAFTVKEPPAERVYVMHQTVVRREREQSAPPKKSAAAKRP